MDLHRTDGSILTSATAECEGHWTALRVGNIAWGTSQNEVAFVRAGPFLSGIDLRSLLNRRLLELFDIAYDGNRDLLLKFMQGRPGN